MLNCHYIDPGKTAAEMPSSKAFPTAACAIELLNESIFDTWMMLAASWLSGDTITTTSDRTITRNASTA